MIQRVQIGRTGIITVFFKYGVVYGNVFLCNEVYSSHDIPQHDYVLQPTLIGTAQRPTE